MTPGFVSREMISAFDCIVKWTLPNSGEIEKPRIQLPARQRFSDSNLRAGETATAQTPARTARDDGRSCLVREFQDAHDLLGVQSEHDAARHLLHSGGSVRGIREQVFFRPQHV